MNCMQDFLNACLNEMKYSTLRRGIEMFSHVNWMRANGTSHTIELCGTSYVTIGVGDCVEHMVNLI